MNLGVCRTGNYTAWPRSGSSVIPNSCTALNTNLRKAIIIGKRIDSQLRSPLLITWLLLLLPPLSQVLSSSWLEALDGRTAYRTSHCPPLCLPSPSAPCILIMPSMASLPASFANEMLQSKLIRGCLRAKIAIGRQ